MKDGIEVAERGNTAWMKLGQTEIGRVLESNGPFASVYDFFPDATPENLALHRHWPEPRALEPHTDKLVTPIQSYVIRTLQAPGACRTEGIVLSRTEVAACEKLHRARSDPSYVENVLLAIEAGQAVLVDDDHPSDDYLRSEPTPGHIHGHCARHIDGRGAEALVTGNLIHSPIQCRYPHRNFRHGANNPPAALTRRNFFERFSDCLTKVLTAHFLLPSAGHLKAEGNGFRFAYRDKDRFM